MQVSYCRRWNFKWNRPIDPFTEEEARERDAAGELYSAVIGAPEAPDRIIEVVRPNSIGVWFFDPQQRQSLHYVFRRINENTMFLREMIRWEYPDNKARGLNESSKIEWIRFEQEGVVHVEVRDKSAGETRRTSYRDVDVTSHSEPVPAFGDWMSIVRWDRDTENSLRS